LTLFITTHNIKYNNTDCEYYYYDVVLIVALVAVVYTTGRRLVVVVLVNTCIVVLLDGQNEKGDKKEMNIISLSFFRQL
jgi:hypothetical protein